MSGQEKLEFEALQWSHKLPGADLEIAPDARKQAGAIVPGAIMPIHLHCRGRERHKGTAGLLPQPYQ